MTYPLLPYIVTEVYCVIFAITVWVRLDNTVGSEHEIQQLRYMIYSYLAMLCTDIIWALGEDHIIRLDPRVYAFDNAITIIAISCGCYFWFRFIEDRLHFSDKRLDFLVKIPLFVICTLDFLSIFTGWIFILMRADITSQPDFLILWDLLIIFILWFRRSIPFIVPSGPM